jgi:lambda repressor-like predicted transcriptional regulator
MHPADIKAALEKRGVSQADLAHDLGVSQPTISRIIRGETVSDRLMKGIAEAIGEHPAKVFPGYYLKPPKRASSGRAF